LRIVGAGPYEARLRRFAHEYGVADRVEIGKVAPSDRAGMASLLANAALMILLSDYESQGIAVLEALSLGRPVLVADTAGLHELVENQLVRAIPRRSSADQVAAAILGQLKQPLIPPAIDLPTWDACAADVLAVYRTVVRDAAMGKSLCAF
jgi:glycosyltransferase involved in cell wall biosynthesis